MLRFELNPILLFRLVFNNMSLWPLFLKPKCKNGINLLTCQFYFNFKRVTIVTFKINKQDIKLSWGHYPPPPPPLLKGNCYSLSPPYLLQNVIVFTGDKIYCYITNKWKNRIFLPSRFRFSLILKLMSRGQYNSIFDPRLNWARKYILGFKMHFLCHCELKFIVYVYY